jgi:hypothetical protein
LCDTLDGKRDQIGAIPVRTSRPAAKNWCDAMKLKKFYRAQEVAEALGISKQTLFRYENRGAFPKAGRHPINHWRQYTEEEIAKLKGIMGISMPR